MEEEIHPFGFPLNPRLVEDGTCLLGQLKELLAAAVFETPIPEQFHVVAARIEVAEVADHDLASGFADREHGLQEVNENAVGKVVEEAGGPDEVIATSREESEDVALVEMQIFSEGGAETLGVLNGVDVHVDAIHPGGHAGLALEPLADVTGGTTGDIEDLEPVTFGPSEGTVTAEEPVKIGLPVADGAGRGLGVEKEVPAALARVFRDAGCVDVVDDFEVTAVAMFLEDGLGLKGIWPVLAGPFTSQLDDALAGYEARPDVVAQLPDGSVERPVVGRHRTSLGDEVFQDEAEITEQVAIDRL